MLPDAKEWIDHECGICDPLKANFLAQMEHNTGITCRMKTEPKQVEA